MAASTVDACPICVLFLMFVNWVRALVLLASPVAYVRDLVLCAGAVVWNLFLCFLVRCLYFVFVDWSTLRNNGVDIWGTWGVGGVIDLVCCVSLLVYSRTLELSGAPVVVVFDFSLYVLFCTARSVILISCCISLPMLLLPKLFIALAQSTIVAINLSACGMVGRVSFLWLKCMVSVKCFLLVDFMWHLCVW